MEATTTAKGQIVIPSALRKKYGIKEGTRIRIEEDENNQTILLKPVTQQSIGSFRGALHRRSGEKPLTQQLLEERAADLRKEEAKLAKHRPR